MPRRWRPTTSTLPSPIDDPAPPRRLAPGAGAASTLLFQVPPGTLALYLGFFAGFLLYIGAADILPQAHSEHSSVLTIALTCLGAAFMFVVSRVVG